MKFFRNKKAAMELSINAIVIVVLAFTLLGLGLVFIRGQFKSLGGTTDTINEQIKQQVLDDLRTGNKKLSFPTNELTVAAGDSTDFAIGVKNTDSGLLSFKVALSPVSSDVSSNAPFGTAYSTKFIDPILKKNNNGITVATPTPPIYLSSSTNQGGFFWDINAQTISSPGDSKIIGIKYSAAPKGNYIYKLTILRDDGTEYDSKSFFVKVS